MEEKQILSTLVRNHPGVLLRVAGLFSRRGFNIESLTASETQDPAYSRMTIVISGDIETVEQVKHQLEKIVDVKKVSHLKIEQASCSELLLVKVKALPEEDVYKRQGYQFHGNVLKEKYHLNRCELIKKGFHRRSRLSVKTFF